MANYGPEDELGLRCLWVSYLPCKAIAVYQNKAELTMCVPYMQERAESLSNYLLSETPNITIMVDKEMNIVEFNTAAEKAFKHYPQGSTCRSVLYEIMDSSDFEFVFPAIESILIRKSTLKEYGIITEQNLLYMWQKKILVMGIFRDITKEEQDWKISITLRAETMEMAQKGY